jgi:hypothetical protein
MTVDVKVPVEVNGKIKEKVVGTVDRGTYVDAPAQQDVPGETKKWTRDGTLDGVYPGTPDKRGPVGRAVIERMRSEGKLVGTPPNEKVYHAPTQKWYPIAETQMGHVEDAVKWWNSV